MHLLLKTFSVLCVLASAGAASPAVLFSDDFSDPGFTSTHWSNSTFDGAGNLLEANPWTVTEGTYNNANFDRNFDFSLANTPAYGQFTLEVDLLATYDSGLVLRSDATGANALVFISRPAVGDAYFIVRKDGQWNAELGRFSGISSFVNQGLHLTIAASGNTFTATATYDGDIAYSTSIINEPLTASLSGGLVGVYKFGTGQPDSFANFSATGSEFVSSPVPEPSTWLSALALLGTAGMRLRSRRPLPA